MMTLTPLAERLRPKTLDDVLGQEHLLGEGAALRLALSAGRPHSCILWGAPGVGKTTIAQLLGNAFSAKFISISAVLGSVKDIRSAIEQAQNHRNATGGNTIVFVDEVHRFNKSQQDAFLPHIESGLFIFIGATTQNPSFEVNSALLSRVRVYALRPLETQHLRTLVMRAQSVEPQMPPMDEDALEYLLQYADGDGRKLINALEIWLHSGSENTKIEQLLGEQMRRYDKSADVFYATISALHKAVRASKPDLALYWLTRMLDGGVDPLYLARRLVRMAWEDVGLADPRAMSIANDAAAAYERLGSPEGELALAQAAVYLSVAPKSNAGYLAYERAQAWIKRSGSDSAKLPNTPFYEPQQSGLEIKISAKLKLASGN